ncbi:glycerol-3-phosphate acyltransferase [Grosmannia clavigera kw1407]|uniref:Glycerol-3-phosphate acyltransferase n=1 Tax=Grosmannia clavigera (strain kw1407 / UAMH 11150) TaxID=655863 RepID=F0XSY9_GROCL|nr:glycerol-3-phosphate acyltransferase [Grosmannia clavigera kw1407]EFW99273.1 glycerol-3-phosphate acyltransferase [Grosmannia clavigera kw1407]
MSEDDDSTQPVEAPDLKILGDSVTFQPSGVEATEGPDGHKQTEEALMKRMHSFRAEPLQFLRQVSLYVSGTGWRAYDNVIGQPIFYAGFSEHMKGMVLSAPLLQRKIGELAEQAVAREAAAGGWRPEQQAGRREQRQAQVEGWLRDVAAQWTDGMICKFESKTFIRGAYYLVTQLLTRAYHQGIHVASEDVVMLRAVAEQASRAGQSILFLPCHRSHVDYVSLQLICYRLGIAMPVVVAGDNLNFPLVGSFLQHAGAMYIRRAFGDDQLYATLVQAYVDALLRGGYNLECFIEGGRSRTGKLLPPKFGILSFVLDSLLSGRVHDAIVIPVSTQYDKVIETEGYVTELLGTPKKAENLADFIAGGSNVLSLRLGRVDVRFHAPWSLRAFVDEQLAVRTASRDTPPDTSPAIRQQLLRTLGYRVLKHINDVSVVMPTALVGTVLLTLRGRGVGKAEMVRRVRWLSGRIRAKGGRVAHVEAAALPDVVDRALEVLGRDLVGELDDLAEPVYYAVDRFQLSFYRNMTIHLFVSEALVSAALYTRVKQGGGPAQQDITYADLHSQVLFLSSLFRGEFIFASEGLDVNLDRTLRGLAADGVIHLAETTDETTGTRSIAMVGLSDQERAIGRENYDFYCFLIWPFIEASWLAAVSLMGLTPPPGLHDDVWIEVAKAQNSAQFLGKTLYHEGDLSYFEAVNKETLKNAYQRFHEEGILRLVRSKDAKNTPPRLQLAPEWRPQRDPTTGALVPAGRLWDFTAKIAASRREGKNRRDGATVSTRVMALADSVGSRLFDEAIQAAARKDGAPVQLTDEEAVSLQRSTGRQNRRRRRSFDSRQASRL